MSEFPKGKGHCKGCECLACRFFIDKTCPLICIWPSGNVYCKSKTSGCPSKGDV